MMVSANADQKKQAGYNLLHTNDSSSRLCLGPPHGSARHATGTPYVQPTNCGKLYERISPLGRNKDASLVRRTGPSDLERRKGERYICTARSVGSPEPAAQKAPFAACRPKRSSRSARRRHP